LDVLKINIKEYSKEPVSEHKPLEAFLEFEEEF
jgi:hypothetical protein